MASTSQPPAEVNQRLDRLEAQMKQVNESLSLIVARFCRDDDKKGEKRPRPDDDSDDEDAEQLRGRHQRPRTERDLSRGKEPASRGSQYGQGSQHRSSGESHQRRRRLIVQGDSEEDEEERRRRELGKKAAEDEEEEELQNVPSRDPQGNPYSYQARIALMHTLRRQNQRPRERTINLPPPSNSVNRQSQLEADEALARQMQRDEDEEAARVQAINSAAANAQTPSAECPAFEDINFAGIEGALFNLRSRRAEEGKTEVPRPRIIGVKAYTRRKGEVVLKIERENGAFEETVYKELHRLGTNELIQLSRLLRRCRHKYAPEAYQRVNYELTLRYEHSKQRRSGRLTEPWAHIDTSIPAGVSFTKNGGIISEPVAGMFFISMGAEPCFLRADQIGLYHLDDLEFILESVPITPSGNRLRTLIKEEMSRRIATKSYQALKVYKELN